MLRKCFRENCSNINAIKAQIHTFVLLGASAALTLESRPCASTSFARGKVFAANTVQPPVTTGTPRDDKAGMQETRKLQYRLHLRCRRLLLGLMDNVCFAGSETICRRMVSFHTASLLAAPLLLMLQRNQKTAMHLTSVELRGHCA